MLQNDKASVNFRSGSVTCTDLKPMSAYSHKAVPEAKPCPVCHSPVSETPLVFPDYSLLMV